LNAITRRGVSTLPAHILKREMQNSQIAMKTYHPVTVASRLAPKVRHATATSDGAWENTTRDGMVTAATIPRETKILASNSDLCNFAASVLMGFLLLVISRTMDPECLRDHVNVHRWLTKELAIGCKPDPIRRFHPETPDAEVLKGG
jgi:hypothetical protein